MSHAIDILDHAIKGDPGGLSFLEQTSSIYVLDAATTPGRPTIYGWWNYLNDALNEVEAYEVEGRHDASPIDAHVRLLATITRRVARRPLASDRHLVSTCLANASMSHMSLLSDENLAQTLVKNNDELRERNMGRIAALVFDYSFHRRDSSNCSMMQSSLSISAFSDPIAMEQLCGIVAANAVASGHEAIRHLVSDWILPSIQTLPSLAVAAIMTHIAVEAMGKGCPAGTHDVMKSLAPSVFQRALGPILIDSLRESDEVGEDAMVDSSSGSGGGSVEHRTAALALRSVDSWCDANSIGAVKLTSIFTSSNINILEAIADALYSNAEIVIDAVSDLIETMLKHDAREANVSLGISIAGSVMSNCLPPGMANQLLTAQQITGENEKSRIAILSELVSAVGLQRFRFTERQSKGDTAVCRNLARTAAKVLLESQDLIKNETLQAPPSGVIDMLFKAVSHPSVYVCSIAIDALSVVVSSNSDLSTRLLPQLQGKAIIPMALVHDIDGGFDDYINFRDRVLASGLCACYIGCSNFYLESCATAIGEFCQVTSPSPHLPYQLEAALFCMIALADKAPNAKGGGDKQVLCSQLEKMITALKTSATATSIPIVTARMCLFVNKYAKCIHSCSPVVFQHASELVVSLFEEQNIGRLATTDIYNISPLSEACNALKQLLSCSTDLFSTPQARKLLLDAWTMPYTQQQIIWTIQDRAALCSGLVSVIVTMPTEKWLEYLDELAQPILSCLNGLTKELDNAIETGKHERDISPMMSRLAIEISLLAAIVKCFIQTSLPRNMSGETKADMIVSHRNAVVTLLQKCWPGITHVSKHCTNEDIATSIGTFLSNSLQTEPHLLLEISGLAKISLGEAMKTNNPLSLVPFLLFMQKFMHLHGSKIEISPANTVYDSVRIEAKNLMLMSYTGVRHSTADNYVEVAPSMFGTLESCVSKCPLFLISLSRDSQPPGEVILSSVESAPLALNSNENGVAQSTLAFLRQLISSIMTSINLDGLEEDEKQAISHVVQKVKHSIQTEVLSTAITLACIGMSPQEILEPMVKLIQLILKFSQWTEIEASVSAAINISAFQLGNEAKSALFEAFRKSSQSEYTNSNFGTMIKQAWALHQTDDTGSIAGGEAVLQFIEKWNS